MCEPAFLQEVNFLEKASYLKSPKLYKMQCNIFLSDCQLEFLMKNQPSLREISPNAAIFTTLPSSKRDKPAPDYDTATAEENEDSLLPEPLTSLSDYNAINMEGMLL